MMPSPSELKYFLEICHTQNLSRAAERLGVSQPALTLAIRRLEDSLGQAVFIRSKSGVTLTRAGTKLMNRARVLLETWEDLREEATQDEKEVRGVYTIGCHPSVGLYTLPSFLTDLVRTHPKLEIKLAHGLSRLITEEVISQKVDFAIVVNPVAHPDLVIKNLLTDQVGFWRGPGSSSLQDPAGESAVLICEPELSQTQTLLKKLNKKGQRFQRIMTSSNLEVITALVAKGAGVGILPGRVAQKDPHLKLQKLSGTWPQFEDKICLIYRADAQKSQAARTIIAFITTKLVEA